MPGEIYTAYGRGSGGRCEGGLDVCDWAVVDILAVVAMLLLWRDSHGPARKGHTRCSVWESVGEGEEREAERGGMRRTSRY